MYKLDILSFRLWVVSSVTTQCKTQYVRRSSYIPHIVFKCLLDSVQGIPISGLWIYLAVFIHFKISNISTTNDERSFILSLTWILSKQYFQLFIPNYFSWFSIIFVLQVKINVYGTLEPFPTYAYWWNILLMSSNKLTMTP